jgi:hypothetical protein
MMGITNTTLREHAFLAGMYSDGYFPDHLVDKCVMILRTLCERIDAERPADLSGLYALTHAATEQINVLEDEFYAADSEIETVARELLAADFAFVATAYGFADADVEDLIATREW